MGKHKGKLIHIRLHPRTHMRLKVQVAESNTTIQTYANRAIRVAMRKQWEEKRRAQKAGRHEKANVVQS